MAQPKPDLSETLSTQFYRNLLNLQDGLSECRDYAQNQDKLDALQKKQLIVLLAKVRAADKILTQSLNCIERMKEEASKLDMEGIKHISAVMKKANRMVKPKSSS